ncbi:cell division cycle and apoptosis regulator protein 1 [Tanacetum coccineum]
MIVIRCRRAHPVYRALQEILNRTFLNLYALDQALLVFDSKGGIYEDRIPHLCNMLRFAFLKDESSLMAIGGSWDTLDGNDPSLDKSSLLQTVLRMVLV